MKKGLLLLVPFFLLTATAAWSQEKSKYAEATRLITSMDLDGDGVICEMETCSYFSEKFDSLDKNADNFLDKREVAIYLKREKINLPGFINPCSLTFE